MTENELSKIIVDVASQIHTKLGPGLDENLWQRCYENLSQRREDAKNKKLCDLASLREKIKCYD